MHPLNHVWSSGIAAAAVAYIFSPADIITWAAIGIAATIAIDIDHLILLALFDRRSIRLETNVKEWNDTFIKVRNFHIYKSVSHLAILSAIVFLFALTEIIFFIPIIASLIVHVISDILPDIYIHSYRRMVLGSVKECMRCRSSNMLEIHGSLSRTLSCIILCRKCHEDVHKFQDPYDRKLMNSIRNGFKNKKTNS